ncbi:Type III restriction-modification system methylation subunit (EC 2.1.1.72) [Oscillospiraceae bacterium]|nr:Type III restriction-modification system methylation subunit (EC 2.1.1.72) [Oscillospiraceae bacterium]
MEHMKFETPDMVSENIDKIAALFPTAITEMRGEDGEIKRGVNFEVLKQILSRDVVDGDECYEFTWVGKKAAMAEASRPITKTLRPVKEDSRNWDTTENLYIEGDNLEVLKILQESYLGKVKMIYIDPPYNTGNDFIYADDFMRTQEEENEQMGMYDEDENRLFKNADTRGRFHSDWCSMIYSRLMLARNLLTEDGVVFISIDDNEEFNLKEICDEVFGGGNFVAQLAVQLNPRGRNLDRYIAKTHESVLVYVSDYLNTASILGIEKEGKMVDEYNKSDVRGAYRLIGLRNRNQAFNPITRPNLYYPLYVDPNTKMVSTVKTDTFTDEVFPDTPDGIKTCWTWMKKKVDSENHLITAERTGNEWRIFRKDYLVAEDGSTATTLVKSLWTENTINNDYGKKAIKELFGSNVMSFPKPPELIKRMAAIGSGQDSIILDFFSGSATTAHAVMQLNAEDGGHRKFIMVQLPEKCDESSEAYKAGYKNICEIGKERIRRAGDKIKSEHPDAKLDTGFRVFRVDESNMEDIYYHPEELIQTMLGGMVSNIKPDRTDLDLLYACLLDWGVEISLSHTQAVIDGCTVHNVDNGALCACFDERVPLSVIDYMAKQQPLRAVFRDSSFAADDSKINVTEIFKNLSPDTKVKVI